MRALLLFVASLAVGTCVAQTVVVATTNGPVRGVFQAADNTTSWRGIPFAEPPVGALRFADPAPLNRTWTTPLDASRWSAGCMARCPITSFPKPELMCAATVSEDCLYLNVYSPSDFDTHGAGPLPVIVFIHGGNYKYGASGVPIYDGADLARNERVVVVTLNYRLGVFGALYTGSVRGNFQTKDQRMALRWVQANIRGFGGDPTRVTITGQSAGAFSVATHLSSPLSWPLFQRAIIVSNPFAIPAWNPESGLQLGERLLRNVSCPDSGGVDELACLRALSAEQLLTASALDFTKKPDHLLEMAMPWCPVVDGTDELPMQPQQAMLTGKFNRVPILFGTVANESVQFVYDASPAPMNGVEYYAMLDMVFGFDNLTSIDGVYGKLPAKDWSDARLFLSRPMTDYVFYCVGRAMGAAMTRHAPTYMWLFDYASSLNQWIFGKYMPWCVTNVCHAQDLAFIFNPFRWAHLDNVSYEIPSPTAAETGLAHFVQRAWGNFARTGDPNPLPQGITWPRFDGAANNLVNYSIPPHVIQNYRHDECALWDKFGYFRR